MIEVCAASREHLLAGTGALQARVAALEAPNAPVRAKHAQRAKRLPVGVAAGR